MAQCPCPINIKDPRAKHSSVRLVVPCTKCPICLQNRRTEWSIRLGEELRTAKNAWFLTLTYSDEYIPISKHGIETLDKTDVQKFNKRLWQHVKRSYKKDTQYPKLRYYAVGEYGTETQRPHYHGIYFNVPKEVIYKMQEIWPLGQIHIGTCTPASIHYVTKYMINNEEETEYREKPKALMSTKPALGAEYLKRNDAWHVINEAPYMVQNGKKTRLPRYYKDRIFTESEKEKMAKKYQSIADIEIKNAWLEAAKKDYNYEETRIESIENQFRIINKQSKSK